VTVPVGLIRRYHRARRQRPDLCAFIYAIQAGGARGPIKIGVTDNPAERLKTLQQGNHLELHGIAAWWDFRFVEKSLHEQFASARIRGEWFRPVPELVDTVVAIGGEFCDWPHSELLDPAQFPMWDGCDTRQWATTA
jgi:hypothetical protein